MKRTLRCLLGLLALLPAHLPAQQGAAPARKQGTIYKEEVDSLIRVVRETARSRELPALGGDSVLATAKILTAMGHCHRFYDLNAGPVVRPSLQFLIRHRKADGSFGDVAATAWTVDALLAYDPEGYREEVELARRWLAARGGELPGLQPEVSKVLAQVRADVFPQHLGAAAQLVPGWLAAPDTLPREQAADALVQLVACQVANRLLDKAGQQQPEASAVFTPAQQQGFAFLLAQQQDGVFSVTVAPGKSFPDPGFTALGLLALQTKPKASRSAEEQATLEKGLRWLLDQQEPDGTIGKQVPNYTTCAAVAALARWGDPTARPALEKAQKAILGFQNIEQSGYDRRDPDYGSIGYGNSQRGDLSNLHFSLEALRTTGLPADHEAFQKALVFLQRTQNLKATNDFSGKVKDPDRQGQVIDVTPGDDGGASYYPGNSNAGYLVQPDGRSVPRSYGSMTYSLLKSYTLAGLPAGDQRVLAAVKWIQQNWDLATNPGADPALGEKVKYQGLFYYYMVLAQALDLAGLQQVSVPGPKDEKGQPTTVQVDWRKALRAQLEGMQRPDGSWLNGENGRWYENLPLLCTCYAMVALELCR
ncbi:MAG: hypothetical protein FJ265_01675 [Planctomycetes bacterium]|nr:hypothetical protein [Planctomycetota bacterium]